MNQSKIFGKQAFKIIGLIVLLSLSSVLAAFYLNLGVLMFFLISLVGGWTYYQNYQRQKKQDLIEIKVAVDCLGGIVRTINEDISQVRLMISYYKQQFTKIERYIWSILPNEKSNSLNLFSKNDNDNHKSSDTDWIDLVKIYDKAVSNRPNIPDLEKMTPQSIHQTCNIFEEYRNKMTFFCEYLAKKSEEDLNRFEHLLTRAEAVTKFKIK